MTNVLAHPAPMKRNTKHVQPAALEVSARLDDAQVHLVLTHADSSTQRIVLPAVAAKAFARLVAVAAAGL